MGKQKEKSDHAAQRVIPLMEMQQEFWSRNINPKSKGKILLRKSLKKREN